MHLRDWYDTPAAELSCTIELKNEGVKNGDAQSQNEKSAPYIMVV